jgi:tetratricopeptide (TPR) repeat protein
VGAWFFVILGPTSSFIPIRDLAFEHRMYLPLAAVVVIAVVIGYALLKRAFATWSVPAPTARLVTGVLVAVVALSLGARTMARNQDYATEVAMWESVARIAPDNGRAHQNLGRAYMMAGRPQDALESLKRAVEINPYHAKAHVNLGNLFLMDGQVDRAIPHYEAAAEINPELSAPHTNLGALYLNTRDYGKAIEHLRKAVSIDKRDADARRNLGLAYVRTGRPDEAIELFREATRINPEFADAWCSLGLALERLDRRDEAIEAFRRAVAISPDHPRAKPALERLAPAAIEQN